MDKLIQIKNIIECFQYNIEAGKAETFHSNKGGQYTNGPPPVLSKLVPSQYKELNWYCDAILAIINQEE